ncbi:MAG: hypothetical protein J6H22_05135 [Pseudobutyrivibrio sp.]|nr:hypothetical protein [Pseudobutyrivibrio sp.]
MKQKLLLVCMVLTLGLVGCGTDTKKSQIPDNPTEDVVVDENTTDTTDDTSETSQTSDSEQPEDANFLDGPDGTYSAIFTEEIEGKEISYEVSYTFNSDGTGVYNGQDTIDFTWDAENNFIMINDDKHPFELNDDCLTVEEFHGIEEYYKQ